MIIIHICIFVLVYVLFEGIEHGHFARRSRELFQVEGLNPPPRPPKKTQNKQNQQTKQNKQKKTHGSKQLN